MKVLFVHNNFPAQFRGLVQALGSDSQNSVAAIGSETARAMPKVRLVKYQTPVANVIATHPFARRFDVECRRAEQVLFAASELAASGFEPEVIIVHCGWGESLPLRGVFPGARIITYCEFYYRPEGQDVHFEADGPRLGVDGVVALQCKNASSLLSLVESDLGLSPTHWQKSTYPSEFHHKIKVIHEGVDLEKLKPDASARFKLPGGEILHRGREVVTYVARNLEPIGAITYSCAPCPKSCEVGRKRKSSWSEAKGRPTAPMLRRERLGRRTISTKRSVTSTSRVFISCLRSPTMNT